MFVIISVIYRPIEQLLSRTIAERRARGHARALAARADRDPGGLRAALPGRRAGAARRAGRPRVRPLRARCTTCWSSARSPTPPATSRAAGWPGTSTSRLFGGLVLMESVSRICFALAVALGIASGQTAVALGIAAAPFVSLVVVPAAFARQARRSAGTPHEARGRRASGARRRSRSTRPTRRWRGRAPRACRRRPRTTSSRCAAAAASRSGCRASCSPSRRC